MRHTEISIIKRFVSRIEFKNNSCFVYNLMHLKCQTDILHISNKLYSHEYEVKTDINTLAHEKHKCVWKDGKRHSKLEQTVQGLRVNYFTYILPLGLCVNRYINRIHPYFGIIGYEEPIGRGSMKFTKIRDAKLLKNEPLSTNELLLITERASLPSIEREYKKFKAKRFSNQ